MAILGARQWWWKRGYRRFYELAPGRNDPYAMNAGTQDRFEALIAELRGLLRPGADDRVLDIGGGNGLLGTRLFGACRRLVAIDFCSAAIPSTAAQAPTWVLADMARPPFREGSFTLLFSYSTFPHAGSQDAALRMIERWDALLAPGGTLFIGDIPDRRAIPRILLEALPRAYTPTGAKFYFAILMQTFYSRRAVLAHLRGLGYDARIVEQAPQRRFVRSRFDLIGVKGRQAG